jgi:hypothetical protein
MFCTSTEVHDAVDAFHGRGRRAATLTVNDLGVLANLGRAIRRARRPPAASHRELVINAPTCSRCGSPDCRRRGCRGK